MRNYINHITSGNIIGRVIGLLGSVPLAFAICMVWALAWHPTASADRHVSSSRLAEGNWVKVKAPGTGMVIVTDAQLRELGFSDPSKVNVYGLGGRELDFGLGDFTPFDIPLLPSVRTSKGLVFYAVGNVTWTYNLPNSPTPYSHSINQYSFDTWYFLSDADTGGADGLQPSATKAAKCSDPATAFTARALHEEELEPAGEIGAQVWGEDFRSKKNQTFQLSLPGNTGADAKLAVRFAAKTVSGTSSIILTANGTRLPSTTSDKISDCTANSLGRATISVKDVSDLGEKLELGIQYSYSGVLYKARLDYIEVFYERSLKLANGELIFHSALDGGSGYRISGCSSATQIWDVTDPTAPCKVDFLLEGDKAWFMPADSEHHEYVAFDPETVSRGVEGAGKVANQDIHALETPDLVILTLSEYMEGAKIIAAAHEKHDGMRVHVLDVQQVYNEFSGGSPDPGAFRRLLKMWHDRGTDADGHSIRYALLMGKALADNRKISSETKNSGIEPLPMWQSFDGLEETETYSNDLWIGMLRDVEDKGFAMKSARVDVAVGRIPCRTASQALVAAKKIERYMSEPDYGPWRNKVMLIADDDDGGQHYYQAQKVYDALRSNGSGGARVYDRLYLDTYQRVMSAVGVTYPQATERMLENYNTGVMFTNYIGHASPTGWGHEHLWDWPQIQAMANSRLPFFYAATCSFAYWDTVAICGAEELLFNPDGGMVGMIAAARTVYISLNGDLNYQTSRDLFARAADGGTLRWGDVFATGQGRVTDTNSLRYVLIGDPALRIPGGSREVRVTEIDGVDVTASETMPELKAKSSVMVKGEVVTIDGAVDTGFNGTVNVQLFDAERVVTTLGQGSQGVIESYNDRDKRLSMTSVPVKEGIWNAVVHIPPEIQDNYTPGLLSLYAWSDKGEEANGACESFYVYGYDDSSDDTEGPQIEEFYVNSPTLGADTPVSSSMIVYADLRDKSGINISQSGIGHSLTLAIDGKEYFDGLSAHFETDPEDPDFGTLVYPVEGVSPGKHTFTLTAWDNANNCSTAELEVTVGVAVEPSIFDISLVGSDSELGIIVTIDRPNTQMTCRVAIHDLSGRKLCEEEHSLISDFGSRLTTSWNYCDGGGNRVPRGIYICRVTVEAADGLSASKSKKVAVSAETK